MLPFEFVVEVFLSPLKGILAHELTRRGYSQSRIGQILGITQPAVSVYLKNPKSYYEEKLLKIIDRHELQSLVNVAIVLIESTTVEEFLRYVNNYAVTLLSSLRICTLHRIRHGVSPTCEICRDLQIYTETSRNVELGFEILKRCQNCYRLIPKVLSNIVELGLEGPVSFPGRIYVENKQLVVRGKPRPHASRFLSKLLIEVNKLQPGVKAVANIAYVAETCVSEKFRSTTVGPSNSEDDIIINITSVFRSNLYDVVYDKGGSGIEPNAYVFGSDAIEVATKISEIAKCLEAG
ncbi:MAG: thiamine-phosphate synthase family protein [Pyrobaculum sp.]